ncbi:hypothetical protein [Nocardia terpenica]|nr:hypothetical protein [Nocardia terpenica]NQE88691.1 hypothetical protein [Nocardia terpenica]
MTELELHTRTSPLSAHDYLSLELARPLPDLCTGHGLPAIEHRPGIIRFRRAPHGPEQDSPGFFLRWLPRRLFSFKTVHLEVTADLHGDWPICGRCIRSAKVFRLIGHTLVLTGILVLIVLLAGMQVGLGRQIQVPLVFVLFPGWLPCGLLLAAFAYLRARTFVRCRPITSTTTVVIRAHPAFAAAAASDSGPDVG